MAPGPVRVLLSGCGWWARNRTVLPFLRANPDMLQVVAITDLLGGQTEFDEIKQEMLDLNYDVALPKQLTTQTLCNVEAADIREVEKCYDPGNNDTYTLKHPVFKEDKRRVLDILYQKGVSPRRARITKPVFIPTVREVLRKDDVRRRIDAAIINTPNKLHHYLARTSLDNGYHVFAERPIDPADEELLGLAALAKKNHKLLYTDVQRRLEDTFTYIHHVVKYRLDFKDIKDIRVILSSGREMYGWRTDVRRAGGGIVTDEGYHLLDAAMWMLMANNPSTRIRRDDVEGEVIFRRDNGAHLTKVPNDRTIETSAVGLVTLPGKVLLRFDLTYNAPLGSIYECFEVRDQVGNNVRLVRDQSERSNMPAKITHQTGDGQMVTHVAQRPLRVLDQDGTECGMDNALGALRFKVEGMAFAGGANNIGPLRQFIENVRYETYTETMFERYEYNDNNYSGIECDANLTTNTHELIAGIYALRKWS